MTAYKKYLELVGYKPSTIRSLGQIAKEYVDYTAKNPCSVAAYLDYLSQRKSRNNPGKTLSKNHLNLHMYGLKKYFDYLEKTEHTAITHCFLHYKIRQKPIDYLTLEEVKALFEAASQNGKWQYRDRAILACLYHLGLRIGEACDLQVEDINLQTNTVLVKAGKNGYSRQLPLSKNAKEIFINYLENSQIGSNGYFLQGFRNRLNKQIIGRILQKLKQKTTIQKRIYAHLLRHSIATQLLKNGMELEKISRFLGHRSVESTQKYTHLVNDL